MIKYLANSKRAAIAALLLFVPLRSGDVVAGQLFRHASLTIETKTAPVTFDVEVADTEPKREQGLMFRRTLESGRGMIFLFDKEQEIMMWMKNTYVPLDMVFIGADWRVTHVAANAEPLSPAIISSAAAASRVLEIGGGEAAKLGIEEGDTVAFQK